MFMNQFTEGAPDLLQRLEGRFRPWFRSRFSLSLFDWDDVFQDAALRLIVASKGNPQLLRGIAGNGDEVAGYLYRCLDTSVSQMYRKKDSRTTPLSGRDLPAKAAPPASRPCAVEDARCLIARILPKLDSRGKLALSIALGTTTLKQYAQDNNVSERTAARHFHDGIHVLRTVVQAELTAAYGQEAIRTVQAAVATLRSMRASKPIPPGVWRIFRRTDADR